MAQIIDGKLISAQIKDELKEEVQKIKETMLRIQAKMIKYL